MKKDWIATVKTILLITTAFRFWVVFWFAVFFGGWFGFCFFFCIIKKS